MLRGRGNIPLDGRRVPTLSIIADVNACFSSHELRPGAIRVVERPHRSVKRGGEATGFLSSRSSRIDRKARGPGSQVRPRPAASDASVTVAHPLKRRRVAGPEEPAAASATEAAAGGAATLTRDTESAAPPTPRSVDDAGSGAGAGVGAGAATEARHSARSRMGGLVPHTACGAHRTSSLLLGSPLQLHEAFAAAAPAIVRLHCPTAEMSHMTEDSSSDSKAPESKAADGSAQEAFRRWHTRAAGLFREWHSMAAIVRKGQVATVRRAPLPVAVLESATGHPGSAEGGAEGQQEPAELDAMAVLNGVGFHGGSTDAPFRLLGIDFIAPPRCAWLFGDVFRLSRLAKGLRPRGLRLVVADPPWPNKSVQRSKAYKTMSWSRLRSLARLPLKPLLAHGGLVAVWVTHDPASSRLVTEVLFPAWGVREVATWRWLKLAADGQPVVPLPAATEDGGAIQHRKPWEGVIVGRRGGRCGGATGEAPPIPAVAAFAAVPVTHSMKPPLDGLLSPWLPQPASTTRPTPAPTSGGPPSGPAREAATAPSTVSSGTGNAKAETLASLPSPVSALSQLELFARRLRPGFISVGDQVLLLQHAASYRQKQRC